MLGLGLVMPELEGVDALLWVKKLSRKTCISMYSAGFYVAEAVKYNMRVCTLKNAPRDLSWCDRTPLFRSATQKDGIHDSLILQDHYEEAEAVVET